MSMGVRFAFWQAAKEASRQRERADDPDPPAEDVAADRGAAEGTATSTFLVDFAWPSADSSFGRHHPCVHNGAVTRQGLFVPEVDVCRVLTGPSPAMSYLCLQAKAAADRYHQGRAAPVGTASTDLLDHDGTRPRLKIHPAAVSMEPTAAMGMGRRDPINDPLMAAILEHAAARLRGAQTAAARKGSNKQAMAGPNTVPVQPEPQLPSCSRHIDCAEQQFCSRERTCMPSGQCSPRASPVKSAPTGRPIE